MILISFFFFFVSCYRIILILREVLISLRNALLRVLSSYDECTIVLFSVQPRAKNCWIRLCRFLMCIVCICEICKKNEQKKKEKIKIGSDRTTIIHRTIWSSERKRKLIEQRSVKFSTNDYCVPISYILPSYRILVYPRVRVCVSLSLSRSIRRITARTLNRTRSRSFETGFADVTAKKIADSKSARASDRIRRLHYIVFNIRRIARGAMRIEPNLFSFTNEPNHCNAIVNMSDNSCSL